MRKYFKHECSCLLCMCGSDTALEGRGVIVEEGRTADVQMQVLFCENLLPMLFVCIFIAVQASKPVV